jgi:hypothetical protein
VEVVGRNGTPHVARESLGIPIGNGWRQGEGVCVWVGGSAISFFGLLLPLPVPSLASHFRAALFFSFAFVSYTEWASCHVAAGLFTFLR